MKKAANLESVVSADTLPANSKVGKVNCNQVVKSSEMRYSTLATRPLYLFSLKPETDQNEKCQNGPKPWPSILK